MKIITRFAVLRLSVLLTALTLIAWLTGALAQFDFIRLPKETRLAVERLEAAIPGPNQQMTNRAVELFLLLNNLQCTFTLLGDEVSPWLVYDEEERDYSLATGATSESLSPEFHEAFAALLEWHELDRAPVAPCSTPDISFYSLYELAWQPELIVALLPESEVDGFCEALAHVAYFSWTASPSYSDAAFSSWIWTFLGEQYPSAEDRKRIAGPWAPDFYPASLRMTSDFLYYPRLSEWLPAQEFLDTWDIESEEDYAAGLAVAVDVCEQLLALRDTAGANQQALRLLERLEGLETNLVEYLLGYLEGTRKIYATFPR